ncbi:MAG: glutamine-hydrolyzing carbamoyl-phosphate synthase small subunit, partial [Candidatus ainarchaeum sp.]|nr:glutamine-hydrolyzing carbamoyl-phosphate synthase small subunit [Candidatus ainarchaeum sp.]
EDGSVFFGKSFGFEKNSSGEVVFNTGMAGYPESLTDPSYRGQILALTYPLIGNYGVPGKEIFNGIENNFESNEIHVKGLVVSDYSYCHNHWNSEKSLQEWLVGEKIPAITGIDCRALTKKLREKGVMPGKIIIDENEKEPGFEGEKNFVAEVSCKEPVSYGKGKTKIALIDCGVKNSIIKKLLELGSEIKKFPWNYDLFRGRPDFDAIVISNGPGNPKQCLETIETIKKAMDYSIPVFGICLGNQILALAADADTYKLKYGHRGQNQPCFIVGTKKCFITSQNHGFAVDEKTLGNDWEPWFRNLNDGTNEGIRHKTKPFMSVQFHPEAAPGPTDTGFLFEKFLKEAKK